MPELIIDNLNLDGNTIISTDTDGDIVITPNGTGTVVIDTDLDVDDLNFNTGTISTTSGDLTITPFGGLDVIFGNLTATTVPYLDANQKLVSSAVTPTELGHASGVTSSLCGKDQACTLTNKTLTDVVVDSVVYNDQTTPSNPAAGFYKMYMKSDGSAYTLDSSGTEVELGAGGGGAGGLSNAEYNLLIMDEINTRFEVNILGWTGSTTAPTLDLTTQIEGIGSLKWDPAGAETLRSDAMTVPDHLLSTNGLVEIYYQGGDTDYTLKVLDGSNVDQGAVCNADFIVQATGSKRIYCTFIFPSSGSVKVSLESGSDEPAIIMDRVYLGTNFLLRESSQATIVGQAHYVGTSGCLPGRLSTTMGAIATDAQCPGMTIDTNPGPGVIQTADNDLLDLDIVGLPAGIYEVSVSFSQNMNVAATSAVGIGDGTDISGQTPGATTTSIGTPMHLVGVFSYATAGDRNFQIYAGSTANTVTIQAGAATPTSGDVVWTIKRFPSSPVETFTAATVGEHWDVTITGGNATLANVAMPGVIESASWTMTVNTDKGSGGAEIPCSSTNGSTGTTCAVGSESAGIVFDISSPGRYNVCVAATHHYNAYLSASNYKVFQLHETANNSQTSIQSGETTVSSGTADGHGDGNNGDTNPISFCSNFQFDTIGQKTIRLKQGGSAPSANFIYADNTNGRNLHFTVDKMDQQIPAPILVNSVVNTSSGVSAIEAGEINCDAGSAITSQHGAWVSSVGNISAGACVVTLTTGVYGSAPYCWASDTGANPDIIGVSASSATSVTIDCDQDDGTDCTTFDASLFCIGPK
jgi:hypothetical protein